VNSYVSISSYCWIIASRATIGVAVGLGFENRLNPAWVCRDCQPSDEDGILELFNIVFGKNRSRELWEWQYLKAPAGQAVIKLLLDGNRMIGHYAVVPVEITVDGKTVLAAQSIDTMVHPQYRGQGIFTHLAKLVYREISAKRYCCVYGFPNVNSYQGFVKGLGWLGFGMIDAFVAEAKNLRTHSTSSPSRTVFRLRQFDERADVLWTSSAERQKVSVKRTTQYLNWRFALKPGTEYALFGLVDERDNLVGYAVTKFYRERDLLTGHIVDFMCKDNQDITMLLGACYSNLLDGNASRVSCWMDARSQVANQLRTDGFRTETMQAFFGVKPLTDLAEYSTLLSYDNWQITMGDSDVF